MVQCQVFPETFARSKVSISLSDHEDMKRDENSSTQVCLCDIHKYLNLFNVEKHLECLLQIGRQLLQQTQPTMDAFDTQYVYLFTWEETEEAELDVGIIRFQLDITGSKIVWSYQTPIGWSQKRFKTFLPSPGKPLKDDDVTRLLGTFLGEQWTTPRYFSITRSGKFRFLKRIFHEQHLRRCLHNVLSVFTEESEDEILALLPHAALTDHFIHSSMWNTAVKSQTSEGVTLYFTERDFNALNAVYPDAFKWSRLLDDDEDTWITAYINSVPQKRYLVFWSFQNPYPRSLENNAGWSKPLERRH